MLTGSQEKVDQGAFAELQPEDLPEQPAQPLQADRLRIGQVQRSVVIDSPNGEPRSTPGGGRAATVAPHFGQRHPCSRTWVTCGCTGGSSMRS